MAGNPEAISTIIDPAVPKQVQELTLNLEGLEAQMIDTIKAALQLNEITLNSQGSKAFVSNVGKEQAALEKLKAIQIQTQQQQEKLNDLKLKSAISSNKLAIEESKLTQQHLRQQQAQERAAAAAQKALSPYAQLSKELDKLRAHAKDVGVQFGINSEQFKEAQKPVLELDKRIKGIDDSLGQSQRHVGDYGRAFGEAFTEYLPFLGGTIRVKENLKELSESLGATEEKLGTLGTTFAEFTIGGFALAIGLAINYLTQFQGYANKLDIFLAGLKGRANDLGQRIVESAQGPNSTLKKAAEVGNSVFNNGLVGIVVNYFKNLTQESADAAENVEKLNIQLKEESKITDVLNGRDQASADNLRTLAEDKKLEINIRKKYLVDAEEIEKTVLERSKEESKNKLDVAIKQANALGILNKQQIEQLRRGNIALATELANSTNPRKQITKEAYESLVQAYEAQTRVEQVQTQNLQKIRNDRASLEIRAENELAKAKEITDKAVIEGELYKAKLIIDNDEASYSDRIKAIEVFNDRSKRLLEIQKKDQLEAANIASTRGGKNDAVSAEKIRGIIQIQKNELAKLQTQVNEFTNKVEKSTSDKIKKQIDDLFAINKASETELIGLAEDQSNSRISVLETEYLKEADLIEDAFKRKKITQTQHNDQLLLLEDQYNVDRLGQEAFLQQQILQIKQAGEEKDIQAAKAAGAGPDQIKEIRSKSGVKEQKQKLSDAGKSLTVALKKQGTDQGKSDEDTQKKFAEDTAKAVQYLQQVQDEATNAFKANIENEIALLEERKKLIQDTATQQVEAVNRSVDTEVSKQRRIAVINAQAKVQQDRLDAQIRKEKQKEAQFDKAKSIADIIENTAVAITKTLAEGGAIFGIPLVPIIAALGAVQLAAVLSSPVPKFAKGGKTTGEMGGMVVWGENGTELAIEPSGKYYLSPDTATVAQMPANTRIIPNHQLTKPAKMNHAGGEAMSWKQLADAYDRNTMILKKAITSQKQSKPVINGWLNESRSASNWANYERNYFR